MFVVHHFEKWHAAVVLPHGRLDLEAGLRGWRAACERMQRTRIPTRSSPRRGRAQVRADTLRDDGRRRLQPFISRRRSTPASTSADRRSFFRCRRGHHCKIRKLKGPDRVRRPGPCHFNKEQTPSQVVIAAATGISRWTFRCFGHTSSEALRL